MKQALLVFLFIAMALASLHAQTQPNTIHFTLNKQHNSCVKAQINHSDTLTLMYHSSATGENWGTAF